MTIVTGPMVGNTAVPVTDNSAVVRSTLFVSMLLLVWLGLHPFSDLSGLSPQQERPADVIYHAVAFALCGFSFVFAYPILRGAMPAFFRIFTMLLAAWLIVSVITSQDPGLSARRLFVALTDIAMAMMILLIPRGLGEFSRLLAVAAGCVIAACYLGVLFAPTLSIHQFTDAYAADLDGNWRGSFDHKNTAGAMMGVFIIIGLFVATSGRAIAGTAIAIAAAIFLFMTQSKNSIGLMPVALALAFWVEHVKSLWARFTIALGPLLLLNIFSVGTVYSDTVRGIVERLPVDPTFTGRSEIWSFVAERIAERPILGQGLRAFWYTDRVTAGADSNYEWLANVVNSHNGYLDLALTIGLPGLALMIAVFLFYPLVDFHQRRLEPENDRLASLFLRILIFLIYTSTFESFFFDRAFPGWFTIMMAVFGLRYTAKLRVAP